MSGPTIDMFKWLRIKANNYQSTLSFAIYSVYPLRRLYMAIYNLYNEWVAINWSLKYSGIVALNSVLCWDSSFSGKFLGQWNPFCFSHTFILYNTCFIIGPHRSTRHIVRFSGLIHISLLLNTHCYYVNGWKPESFYQVIKNKTSFHENCIGVVIRPSEIMQSADDTLEISLPFLCT